MNTQTKVPVVPSAFLLVFLAALGGLAQPAAADHVNGWSVTWVDAGHGRDRVSEIRQIGDYAWRETPYSGSGTFDFKEVGRNDTSVYLQDPSRNMQLQIDLYAGKVSYQDANNSWTELYDVLGASERTNGWIVRHVSYGQGGRPKGELCQIGDKTWREDNNDGTFTYTEAGRNESAVLLRDPSRSLEMQVDVDAGRIFYRDANNSWTELYDVLSSSARPNGWTVRRVGYGQGGRSKGNFRQTGDRSWQEYDLSGGRAFEYNETGRDDTSVYLRDPSRKMEIQIDLRAGKIYYRDANNSWTELYDVLGASH